MLDATGNAPEQASEARRESFSFHGRRWTLFRMLVKYAFLNLITLGIYRFWAKTHLRRYIWGSLELDRDRFEYHGTAKELFIGFLIAVAVLFGLSLVDTGIREGIAFGGGGVPYLLEGYGLIYSLILFSLFQFAVYRIWRYRATRTAFRTIRFNMDRAALGYVGESLKWTFVTLLSLGFAYPYAQAALARYKLNRATFGKTGVRCDLTARDLYKRFLLFYVPSLLAYVAVIGVVGLAVLGIPEIRQAIEPEVGVTLPEVMSFDVAYLGPLMWGGILTAFLIVMVLYFFYRLYSYEVTVSRTRIADIPLVASNVPKGRLLAMAALSIVLTALLISGIGGGFAALTALSTSTAAVFSVWHYAIIGFVISPLFIGVIWKTVFGVALLQHLSAATAVIGADRLDAIVQAADSGPTHGEGFADALDVGAF